jgi:hypothetical protein
MSEFEQHILDVLDSSTRFDPAKEQVLRSQITGEFQRNKKRLLIRLIIWHVPFVLILLFGLNLTFAVYERSPFTAHDARLRDPAFLGSAIVAETRAVIQGAAFIVVATAGLVMIRLWYWVTRSRLEILRELKRVELRLVHGSASQATAAPPHGDAAAGPPV